MHRSVVIRRSKLIDLNLLPASMRPHNYPRWYVLGLAAMLAGCVLLAPALVFQHSASRETSHLKGELSVITSQLDSAGLDIGKEKDLRSQISKVEADINTLESERASLPGASGPLADDLSLLYSKIPPDVTITSIARTQKEITVAGESLGIQSVIAYSAALSDSGSFADVTITQVAYGVSGLQFAIKVEQ